MTTESNQASTQFRSAPFRVDSHCMTAGHLNTPPPPPPLCRDQPPPPSAASWPPPPPPPAIQPRPRTTAVDAIAGILTALAVLAATAVVVVALVVFAIVSAVRSDLDPDNSPSIQLLEAEHPVMSDMEIQTGERIAYERSGGEPQIFSLSTSGGPRYHEQEFSAIEPASLDDVANELLTVAAAEGYEFVRTDQRWCSRTRDGARLDTAMSIEVVAVDPYPRPNVEFIPHVTMDLTSIHC